MPNAVTASCCVTACVAGTLTLTCTVIRTTYASGTIVNIFTTSS